MVLVITAVRETVVIQYRDNSAVDVEYSDCCIQFTKKKQNKIKYDTVQSVIVHLRAEANHICTFLLVINSNVGRICYRF